MKQLLVPLFLAAVMAGAASAQQAGAPGPPPGGEACGPECFKKVCAPEPAKKKKERVVFDFKCEDYCSPRCSFCAWLFHCGCREGCGPGCCGQCSKPRVRHVLVKKKTTEERDTYKCVPRLVPVKPPCAPGGPPAPLPPDDEGENLVVPTGPNPIELDSTRPGDKR